MTSELKWRRAGDTSRGVFESERMRQTSLFDNPHLHQRGESTSRAAAQAYLEAGRLGPDEELALNLLLQNPDATAAELDAVGQARAERLGIPFPERQISKRLAGLLQKGKVYVSGTRKPEGCRTAVKTWRAK